MPPARGGQQPIEPFETDLGFPTGFTARPASTGAGYIAAIDFLENYRPPQQNYWPALALALVAQAEHLLSALGVSSLDDVFSAIEIEQEAAGRGARNTLNFIRPDGTQSRLRPTYGRTVAVIRSQMRRFAHPYSPGSQTGAWRSYRPFIKAIYSASPDERSTIARWVWEHGVLPIPETVPSATGARERRERPFSYVLRHMPTVSRPGGAIFQAEAYAYLRADAPNVILEAHAVNVASRRARLVGDVAGFRGDIVELVAEVKDQIINEDNLDEQLGDVFVEIAEVADATAIVFAATFSYEAREALAAQNVIALDREEMATIAAVWDLPKQAEAMGALCYYLARIQNRPQLVTQVRDFCAVHELDIP
ncbi:MAG: hypothetical protein ACRDZ8_15205 [Acidimicrobiales bacterium]